MKLSSMSTTFVRTVLSALLIQFSNAVTNVLVVGDSMGKLMGTELIEMACIGSTVCNAAVSGTTAAQWATYDNKKVKNCDGEWDVVYISVGGNDVLGSDCSIESDELAATIQAAVTNIMTFVAPGASTYLLTGYCIPHESVTSGCDVPSDSIAMSEALNQIDTVDGSVDIIDSSFVCGGSSTSYSDSGYFYDSHHLNLNGYIKVFTQADVLRSMNCDNAPQAPSTNDTPDVTTYDAPNVPTGTKPTTGSGARLINGIHSSFFLVMTMIAVVTFSA